MTHRKTKRRTLTALVGVAALSLTAACSSGQTSSGSGAQSGADARGPITFVTGKDNSGVWPPTIEKWNKAHPNEKVTLKEQSDNADQQHDDIVQHLQAKDASYDVVTVDVVWTPSSPPRAGSTPLKGKFALDTEQAAQASGRGGHLQRQAVRRTVRQRWRDALLPQATSSRPRRRHSTRCGRMCSIAKKNGIDCFAGQFAKYEGWHL